MEKALREMKLENLPEQLFVTAVGMDSFDVAAISTLCHRNGIDTSFEPIVAPASLEA
jgi:hypothetical protein